MLSAKLKSLYELCKKESDFNWSNECENTFQLSKTLLTSISVLTHFDAKLPIVITCDFSGYGIDAVLSHIIQEVEKSVLFASNILSIAE